MTISASVGTSWVVRWLWRNDDGWECQNEAVEDVGGMPGSVAGGATFKADGTSGSIL